MAVSSDDLDWKALEILRVLRETEEELTTSEIRETTGLEPTRVIRYRVAEYLEPAGLVKSRQPTSEGTVVPAKRIQLTERGREFAADLGDRDDDDDVSVSELPERLEQVDSRLTALEQQVEQNSTALEQRRETDSDVAQTLKDIDQRLSSLETQFEALQQQSEAA
jgi:DNA-binding PadR family transcriptional regulator